MDCGARLLVPATDYERLLRDHSVGTGVILRVQHFLTADAATSTCLTKRLKVRATMTESVMHFNTFALHLVRPHAQSNIFRVHSAKAACSQELPSLTTFFYCFDSLKLLQFLFLPLNVVDHHSSKCCCMAQFPMM